jgi:hypothetical protein
VGTHWEILEDEQSDLISNFSVHFGYEDKNKLRKPGKDR